MKRGKFEHPRPVKPARKGLGVKVAGLALAGLLVFGCGVGGTLAWLLDKSETVTNTFTSSDISITLEETGTENNQKSFQMIPGHTIDKDPVVTVVDGSEDCWLFVKIQESTTPDLDSYIRYAIADGWSVVSPALADGATLDLVGNDEIVIGRRVYKDDTDKAFSILGGGMYTYTENGLSISYSWVTDEVFVLPTVTKDMMDSIENAPQPTLTFTAYATQLYKTNSDGNPETTTDEFTAAEAWELAQTRDPANP